jgi:hypothetical protein
MRPAPSVRYTSRSAHGELLVWGAPLQREMRALTEPASTSILPTVERSCRGRVRHVKVRRLSRHGP